MTLTAEYAPDMTTTSEQWLSRAEAAALISKSTQTIDRYVRDGLLTRYRTADGRRAPRFRIEDVRPLLDVVPERDSDTTR